MQTQPLFYQRIAALSKEKHGDWYLARDHGYQFARETNCLYVAAIEIPQACREYPIVFASAADGSVFPVLLLGLKTAQNLYLDGEGNWRARYLPAYLRRYPFVLAKLEDGERYTVCIDESCSGFNTVQEGEALFDAQGEQGALLQKTVAFLKDYQAHVQWTEDFCRDLQGLEVLEPVQANVSLDSGERFSLTGMLAVSRDRLKALDDGQLAELARKDYLELIYAHRVSLGNMQNLITYMS